MKKLSIINIKITNFRGIKNLNLEFNSNHNFLRGPNGSGKTTILDAIRYMFFTKDSNTQFIDNESIKYKTSPDISMLLELDGRIIKIVTRNKKWWIDDIQQKSYIDQLSKELGIQSVNEILFSITPQELNKKLTSQKSMESEGFKDDVIVIFNKENDNIFDESKINKINEEIDSRRRTCKEIKNLIKDYEADLDYLKNNEEIFPEMQIEEDEIELYKELKELKIKKMIMRIWNMIFQQKKNKNI